LLELDINCTNQLYGSTARMAYNTSYKARGKVVGIAIASDRYFSKTDS